MPHIQVADARFFYEDIGLGDPVLFLHGGYSRGIIAFSGQIQPFFHSYRCLLPDLRGHGRTVSENSYWDTPLMAQDMLGFLTALGIQSAHLIGYSMGGGIALHLAASAPERVKSVITIGTGGIADPTGADAYEPEALLASGQTDFIKQMKALHGDAHRGDWQQYLRLSARDWRLYPNLSQEDWQRLSMPCLFIGGEKDTFASLKHLSDMQARCAQAQICVIPGTGHRPHMPSEQARAVNEIMLNFLKGI